MTIPETLRKKMEEKARAYVVGHFQADVRAHIYLAGATALYAELMKPSESDERDAEAAMVAAFSPYAGGQKEDARAHQTSPEQRGLPPVHRAKRTKWVPEANSPGSRSDMHMVPQANGGRPMTDLPIIKKLDALAERAMSGPWVADWRRGHRITTECLDGDDESSCELIARVSGVEANAALIAELRNSYPTLRAIIAELVGALESYTKPNDARYGTRAREALARIHKMGAE